MTGPPRAITRPAGTGRHRHDQFFAEVNDGPVTLTFHFWSGTRLTYRITRAGTTVTGTT